MSVAEFRNFVDLIEGRAMACDGPVTPFLEQLNVASGAEKERFTGILRSLYAGVDSTVLVEVLKEGRRAIGDHFAPNDCYATGPATGDHYRDLVECPACSFISMYDAVMAKINKA